MPSEFDLIRRHFRWPTRHTALAGGDDAALLEAQAGTQLVVSTDMLVEGRHFFANAEPHALGWKTLAVNVSDIAAMAATPRWALLSMALPDADDRWLERFSAGMRACADAFDVDLVGGDTTRGPRSFSITLIGEVPAGMAVRRDGARLGDALWISGQPGRAALALWHLRGGTPLHPDHAADCLDALHRPQPRVTLGRALRGLATAMLDVSDGLLGDLGHLLDASRLGAEIDEAALPVDRLAAACGDHAMAQRSCLHGGDDYELLFTAPPAKHAQIRSAAKAAGTAVTCIGRMTPIETPLTLVTADNRRLPLRAQGFDHFSGNA